MTKKSRVKATFFIGMKITKKASIKKPLILDGILPRDFGAYLSYNDCTCEVADQKVSILISKYSVLVRSYRLTLHKVHESLVHYFHSSLGWVISGKVPIA